MQFPGMSAPVMASSRSTGLVDDKAREQAAAEIAALRERLVDMCPSLLSCRSETVHPRTSDQPQQMHVVMSHSATCTHAWPSAPSSLQPILSHVLCSLHTRMQWE